MAVTHDDVRHVAALARIGVAADRFPALARELSGILDHMAALSRVDLSAMALAERGEGMPLRDDASADVPAAPHPEAFAPSMRDGLFVVPRLESHDDSGSAA